MLLDPAIITATLSREINAIDWHSPENNSKNNIYLYVPRTLPSQEVVQIARAISDSVWSEEPGSIPYGVRVAQSADMDARSDAECIDRRADVIFYLRTDGRIVRNGDEVVPEIIVPPIPEPALLLFPAPAPAPVDGEFSSDSEGEDRNTYPGA